MPNTVAQKLIASHLVSGEMIPGREIGLQIDQTLTQDATGTLVMLALEAMQLDRVKTEVSAQYVDHNLIQEDHKNADDHLFLQSACKRFGVWYSRPGNGVSHPVHMQRFGKPGRILLGSDSHTCAAGALGMLAMGAGGLEVALAMAGEPFFIKMPQVWGIHLTGELSDWVSAKDVILEMLRRHTVSGGVGRIVEYYGPGVDTLSVWDRHTIANMGAELGATTTVFPSDRLTREFLESEGRGENFLELLPDEGASYDLEDEIDLSNLEPLIAKPSSPGNVVPVREVAGEPIYQAYVGSSANPGYRDFAIAARMVEGRRVAEHVSFDINPSSRQTLLQLIDSGLMHTLVSAGARVHQAGCNGCIGMGQAPATKQNSIRTVPRNFPGRSGTREDRVWLSSPETATASAINGKITDPRVLGLVHPTIAEPRGGLLSAEDFGRPLPLEKARSIELVKGPNIASMPEFEPLPDTLTLPVILKTGDDVSTDEIMPAGARVLPYRSNIPEIAKFSFDVLDDTYHDRAMSVRDSDGHAVVGGRNYGQGSSREHAAVAPRYLGLRVVIAQSFARIHWQNLVNFGVLPLTFESESDYDAIEQGDTLVFENLRNTLPSTQAVTLTMKGKDRRITARHDLSERQVDVLLSGGLVLWMREKNAAAV
ncbi:MAG: aconitate hydratase [candidate division Zixibacteria bacterium]|nr:aconitate hydratase [candidate division Zixibacteria bacterium]